MKNKDNGVFVADENACPGCGTILDHYTVDGICSNCESAARRDDSEEEYEAVDNTDYPTGKADGYWDNYWFDAAGKAHAQDCPTCGGSGQCHAENNGRSLDYTCATCHGSGVVPADDCPEDVAKLIRDDNQRRVFEADEDWDYASGEDDEDSDYEGQECPVCGFDLNRSGECTGNGCGADLCS